jgi:hypothetical protein
MLPGSGKHQPHMNSQPEPANGDEMLLLNRDHIVRVAKTAAELIVTTTSGKLVFSGAPDAIAEFRDLLLNDIQSNLVAVPPPLRHCVNQHRSEE